MVVTGNPRHLINRGHLLKSWYTLEETLYGTHWKMTSLNTVGNSEVILSTSVTIPLTDKCSIKSITSNDEVLSNSVLLTGVTWQAPHKI